MPRWFQQEEFLRNPYPYYVRLRSEGAVRNEEGLGWVVLSYRDIGALWGEKRLSSAVGPVFMNRVPAPLRPYCQDLARTLEGFLLFCDPPRHTRLKTAVSPLFTPGAVKRHEERIRAHVRALLPEQPGPWDAVTGLADRLPPLFMAELLGLPDVGPIQDWSHDLTGFLGNPSTTMEEIERAARAARTLGGLFQELARSRRAEPRDDLTSQLVAGGLDEADVASLAAVLVAAGHDTTASLIGNSLLALLQHPEEWDLLVRRPEGIDVAIEEVLRYDGPSQSAPRVVLEDFSYDGHWWRQGEVIHLLLGAANRDPERFERAEEFWPHRKGNRHFGFGHGLHFCVGAFLARLQTRVVLEELLARFPRTRLVGEPGRRLSMAWRQLASLPLELG